jgi:hypothetical protein
MATVFKVIVLLTAHPKYSLNLTEAHCLRMNN